MSDTGSESLGGKQPDRALEKQFKTRLVTVGEVTSTNEVLFRASIDEYPIGTALLARTQIAGRGRADRTWQSGVGGMYLSILVRPSRVEGLSLFGAFCLVELCREFGLDTLIRWPNDVYKDGKKLAGILPQVKFQGAKIERVVLGVGLNVAQPLAHFDPTIRDKVTTLVALTGREFEVEDVAVRFLSVFEREFVRYESTGCWPLVQLCEPHLEGLCEKSTAWAVQEDGSQRELGRVAGLGKHGELRFADGTHLCNLGPRERLSLKY
jgi:biotin-[acetyl-CoA-carboxylase] ligase BirA-like protein